MRGPRTYTGEDVVELSCHGSPVVLRVVLERLIAEGARLAAPGEFTRRAYLNGRMDLAQAEAVALLITARTERAVTLAARGVAGEFGRIVRDLRDRVLDVMAGLEAALDFPDDMVGPDPRKVADHVEELATRVVALRASVLRGRVAHAGVTVAIVGAPNAGKSSLLNALVGRDRAIVSPLAGTTRDVVDAMIVLAGTPVRLLDTAGLAPARDPLEAEGMRRTRDSIAESDLVLVVVERTCPAPAAVLEETASRPRIIVRSKSDLPPHPSSFGLAGALDVSAVTGEGIDSLVERLVAAVTARSDDGDGAALLASVRQLDELSNLERNLQSAGQQLRAAPLEVALVDLHEALRRASDLIGVGVGDAVLDRIFATFCLGK